MAEIDTALFFREKYGKELKWDSLEQSYFNDPEGDTAIGPNLIYAHGDSLMSMLSVPDPEILVAPDTRRGVKTAPIVERLDSKIVAKTRLKKEVDRGLLNCYLHGELILKHGYDSLYGYAPDYDIGMGMTFTQFDRYGKRLEFGPQKPGWPWVKAVHPKDFVVPWGTIDIEDAPWCAFRFVRSVEHMKRDPKYKNTSRLQADMNMEQYMKSYMHVGAKRMEYKNSQPSMMHALNENTSIRYKEFWEIRDAESNEILVITRDYDKFLRRDRDAIQVALGGLPVTAGTFVPHTRSFWSTPLAYYLGQIQNTQFDISLQAEKQRRISILKFLVRENCMTEQQMRKLMSGSVGAFESVKLSSGNSIRDVIATVPTGSLVDFQLQSQWNQGDAREAIGFSRNQAGEYDSSSRRTAREATFVQQGASLRSNKKSQMVGDVYIGASEKSNKLVFAFWTTPRDVLMEDGFISVTGRDLDSEYSYDLSLSTKRNLSKAERKIEAFQVLMQLAQFPGANLQMLYQYLMDAANDPAFERLLPSPGSNQGGRSPSGGMPTIPGTA
jgi:hypothetical protein